MKLFTFLLALLLFTGFSACENHMDINDIVEGSPSNADTVLAHKFPPFAKKDSVTQKKLVREYQVR
jgi:hypothetical protein